MTILLQKKNLITQKLFLDLSQEVKKLINIYLEIEKLCSFAVDTKLIEKEDKIYCRNRLLSTLKLDDWEENEIRNEVKYPSEILDNICQWAFEKGLIEDNSVTFRDLFDTNL